MNASTARSSTRGIFATSTLATLAALTFAAVGCGGRFRPISAHDVAAPADPRATFAVVLDVANNEKYPIVARDDAHFVLQLRSHVDQDDASRVSVISVQADAGGVRLSASGYLVHPDGTIHRRLDSELEHLQKLLIARLGGSPAVASPQPMPPPNGVLAGAPPPPPPAPPAAGGLPSAWSEPSSDPNTWGRGNFTCLPFYLPAQDQQQLAIKLSTGETADVTLTLAYSPALCRSPNECKQPGGCPALGIGDPEHVARLAGRLTKNELSPQATLIYRGQPVAQLDLSRHGSVAQAMMDVKH